MMAHRFEIKQNKAGDYVARFKYNDETIFLTQGYHSLSSAMSAVESVKRNAPKADVEDNSPSEPTDAISLLRFVDVPAAGRIVTPDHNSKDFRDFDESHRKLSERLLHGNDLREFETSELMVVRKELKIIGSEVREPFFRAEHLWSIAKSTFLWIAEKAADGVIKALAVAALMALAAMLGIQLPVH